MIKVVNIHPTKQYARPIGGTVYNLSPNGGFVYLNDDLISEAEVVAQREPNLVLYNFAGPILDRDTIQIVARGVGANKTTTGSYGVTITEDFGIGDELFVHWLYHPLIIRTEQPTIIMSMAPVTTEVDKLVSFEITTLGVNGGTIINAAGAARNIVDIEVPSAAFENFVGTVALPISDIALPFESSHIKVKRVAATSNDLAGDIALHHMGVEYQRYLV